MHLYCYCSEHIKLNFRIGCPINTLGFIMYAHFVQDVKIYFLGTVTKMKSNIEMETYMLAFHCILWKIN